MKVSRLCIVLCILGVIGIASLAFAPLETLLPAQGQATVPRAALLIQPLMLVLALTGLGCWAAPRAGLEAPVLAAALTGQPALKLLRRSAIPAVPAGVAVTLILAAYGMLTNSTLAAAQGSAMAKAAIDFQPPLITKLLYGGVAEELIARWGVMSGVAVAAVKFGLARGRALGVGLIVAAVLFGLGHVPLLFALMPAPPAWLIAAVVIGNVGPGIIFGLLFWHRGIESAMMAHALGHFLATMAAIS